MEKTRRRLMIEDMQLRGLARIRRMRTSCG